MNLYLISQDKNTGTDCFDSAVVVAKDEDQARMTKMPVIVDCFDEWVDEKDVKVKFIGTTQIEEASIILASYSAG